MAEWRVKITRTYEYDLEADSFEEAVSLANECGFEDNDTTGANITLEKLNGNEINE